jgi:hypothetical protein
VRLLAGLLLAMLIGTLIAPAALAQQAPGSPFGPLQSPAPPPAPTQTQTQAPTQTPGSSSSNDTGPGKGTLALLFVAAILVLAAAVFVIGRDARRTVKPKRRVKSRPRTAEASGARAPGAPPPPPRKARRKRR